MIAKVTWKSLAPVHPEMQDSDLRKGWTIIIYPGGEAKRRPLATVTPYNRTLERQVEHLAETAAVTIRHKSRRRTERMGSQEDDCTERCTAKQVYYPQRHLSRTLSPSSTVHRVSSTGTYECGIGREHRGERQPRRLKGTLDSGIQAADPRPAGISLVLKKQAVAP